MIIWELSSGIKVSVHLNCHKTIPGEIHYVCRRCSTALLSVVNQLDAVTPRTLHRDLETVWPAQCCPLQHTSCIWWEFLWHALRIPSTAEKRDWAQGQSCLASPVAVDSAADNWTLSWSVAHTAVCRWSEKTVMYTVSSHVQYLSRKPVITAISGYQLVAQRSRGGHSYTRQCYWVKGQNVRVVNSHELISSTVKQSRAILQCGQTVKQ